MSQARGRPFAPGNKLGRGRPRGSRNKSTLALQEMLGQHSEALVKKCVVMALNGDTTAMRLCIERLIAPRKQSPVKFKLPPITSLSGLAQAQISMLETLSRGQLTPAEAESIGNLFENRRRMLETEDLAARLDAIEQHHLKEGSS
jgi:Family of unknown function (DUF5681)